LSNDSAAKGFKLIGSMLCLDFLNTVGGRISERAKARAKSYQYEILKDKLEDYKDLLGWYAHAGLPTEKKARRLLQLSQSQPKVADSVFKRGLALREAIYRIIKAAMEHWPADKADIERLNGELLIAKSHEKLAPSEDGFAWAWDEGSEALDSVLWPVARSAAELLTSNSLSRVRQCGGENCGWLFLDTSRNRSRQWCDMKDCGNLAKVRRFRERHHRRKGEKLR
jgi:predicted RNA-binding Zn ribbon-like protein